MGIARLAPVLLGIWLVAAVAFGQDEERSHGHRDRPPQDDNSTRLARVEGLLRRMDANGNGMVEEEEATGFQRQILERVLRRNGMEVKFPVSVKQVREATTNAVRTEGNAESSGGAPNSATKPAAVSGSTIPPANPTAASGTLDIQTQPRVSEPATAIIRKSDSDPGKVIVRKSGRFLSPKERLPQGLPDWFLQKDADGDGQVSMAEFAREWTPDKAREFDSYDLNHDGMITAAECLKRDKPVASIRPVAPQHWGPKTDR